jgi:hypothetical protein
MWCRAWHLRNDVIFGDGKAEINVSAQFLINYLETLTSIRENTTTEEDIKAKKILGSKF